MNNIELETKIKEIISMDNYFDMVIAAKNFEKEYKESDFYKATKQPLSEVIKDAKVYYTLQFENLGQKIQQFINNVDLTQLNSLFDQITTTFADENSNILETLQEFKDLQ